MGSKKRDEQQARRARRREEEEARARALADAAPRLGYERPTPALRAALTHRSFTNELHPAARAANPDNQRLELLGDAVVGLVVASRLMLLEPEAAEGHLSAKRARLINAAALAACAEGQGLEPLLRCGRGELNMGPAARAARLADAFEAVAGALFQDLGLERASEWVWGALLPLYEPLGDDVHSPKSLLQELTVVRHQLLPRYERLEERSSPEGEPLTGAAVWLGERRLAEAYAARPKEAEERAAQLALALLSAPSTASAPPAQARPQPPEPPALHPALPSTRKQRPTADQTKARRPSRRA